MCKLIIAALLLVSSSAFADSMACQKIQDSKTQRACVEKNVQTHFKEMVKIQEIIYASPTIPVKDKQIFQKDQQGWVDSMNEVCNGEVYCLNSETEQRLNDVSAYLASFTKRK